MNFAELPNQVSAIEGFNILNKQSLTRYFYKPLVKFVKNGLILESAINGRKWGLFLEPQPSQL